MEPYLKSDFVGEKGELGTAAKVPPPGSGSEKLDKDQGSENAGKFLVVGNDGIVAPITMAEWQGGSY